MALAESEGPSKGEVKAEEAKAKAIAAARAGNLEVFDRKTKTSRYLIFYSSFCIRHDFVLVDY